MITEILMPGWAKLRTPVQSELNTETLFRKKRKTNKRTNNNNKIQPITQIITAVATATIQKYVVKKGVNALAFSQYQCPW